MRPRAVPERAPPAAPPAAPWARGPADLVAALGGDVERGLGEGEARRRLGDVGPNVLAAAPRRSALSVLLAQFRGLVVALLAAALAASLAQRQWLEAGAVGAVLALNAAIGFATELRATRSLEALRRLGRTLVRVVRGGQERQLPAEELVPGDLLRLEGGDVVPADARLVAASNLSVDESALTGESVPVEKRPDAVAADAPLHARSSALFRGTAITRGSARAVVYATGAATEVGRIAELVAAAAPRGALLEERLDRLGRRLALWSILLAAGAAVAGLLNGRPPRLMVETGVALAIAAIPEGLPVVATITLARGLLRLARRDALVRRLSAVETLGATSVILTDKTGTLTENRMEVAAWRLPSGARAQRDAVRERGRSAEPGGEAGGDLEGQLERAARIGALCNDAASSASARLGDPTELALLDAADALGVDRAALAAAHPRLAEEAFDAAARRMATVHGATDGVLVAVKGAVEAVLPACVAVAGGGALDAAARAEWSAAAEALAADGLRVLALAERHGRDRAGDVYGDLALVGLVALRDPPRADVPGALAACRAAGVRVVLVTGDAPATAAGIAAEVGLAAPGAPVLTGADLARLDPEREPDRSRLLACPVFARVDPAQKLALVRLHQSTGAIVAMTGDGVNDAPALEQADIGVAMGRRGTQVAREAAAMVLRDDAFPSIVAAVRQGRVVFSNVRRFAVYLMSCNTSEVLVVSAASALDVPLPVLPLQILFLNLVTDVFPALALGFGEGDPGAMRRPPRDPREPLVARRHWWAIGAYGVLLALGVLVALLLALGPLGLTGAEATSVSFLALATGQLWHVLDMREAGSHPFRNDVTGSPYVWGAVGLCASLLAAALLVPPLAGVLQLAPPGAAGLAVALGAGLVPTVVAQVARVALARGRRAGATRPRTAA